MVSSDCFSSGIWQINTAVCKGMKSYLLAANISRSGIIQSTEKRVDERTAMACVYFYFQEGDADQISVTSLWASLLHQLLHQSAPDNIANELQEAFDLSLQGTNSLRPFEYFDLFKAQALNFKTVYVVIDALDNCKNYDDGKVQQTLAETLHQLPTNIRVLFSSRHDLLAHYFGFKSVLQIRPCKADIETYTKHRIRNNEHLHRMLSREEDEQEVIDKITEQTVSSQMCVTL